MSRPIITKVRVSTQMNDDQFALVKVYTEHGNIQADDLIFLIFRNGDRFPAGGYLKFDAINGDIAMFSSEDLNYPSNQLSADVYWSRVPPSPESPTAFETFQVSVEY